MSLFFIKLFSQPLRTQWKCAIAVQKASKLINFMRFQKSHINVMKLTGSKLLDSISQQNDTAH